MMGSCSAASLVSTEIVRTFAVGLRSSLSVAVLGSVAEGATVSSRLIEAGHAGDLFLHVSLGHKVREQARACAEGLRALRRHLDDLGVGRVDEDARGGRADLVAAAFGGARDDRP